MAGQGREERKGGGLLTPATSEKLNELAADVFAKGDDKVVVSIYTGPEKVYIVASIEMDYVDIIKCSTHTFIRNDDAGVRIVVGYCELSPRLGCVGLVGDDYHPASRFAVRKAPVAEVSA